MTMPPNDAMSLAANDTTYAMSPAANDANDATSPPRCPKRCPMMMPCHHATHTPNAPHRVATAAMSLLNGNSRRWGWWGRMEEGRECGGMEGRGQRLGMSLSPRVLDSDEGVGWHIRASYFLPPPVLTASSTRAGVNPTCHPPFDFVYPPCGGCFFLRHE